MKNYDVFISHKSEDDYYAEKIYQYLSSKGLIVFKANQTLGEIGSSEYLKIINKAIDNSRCMVVVASSLGNLKSKWVEHEWLSFLSEILAENKLGKIVTLYADKLTLKNIPTELKAQYDCYSFHEENFSRIYNIVRPEGTLAVQVPKKIYKQVKVKMYLSAIIVFLTIAILSAYIHFSFQPYDATIFLKPKKSLNLNSYPPFTGAELSIIISNKDEKKQVLANGEVVLKQLPSTSIGEKVAIKLLKSEENLYWKTEFDSIILQRQLNIDIIPNGHLAHIYGDIKTLAIVGVPKAKIKIDKDTTIYTDENGDFDILLPFHMQKKIYRLEVEKIGFKPYSQNYNPGSITNIILEK